MILPNAEKPLDRSTRRHLVGFKDDLVNWINDNVGHDYIALNRRFALEGEADRSFDLGRQMFRNSFGFEDVDQQLDMHIEWLDDMDNEAIRSEFREGFRDALSRSLGDKGYIAGLRTLVGDLSKRGRAKPARIAKLREVLGDDTAEAIQQVVEQYGPRIQGVEALEAALQGKQRSVEGTPIQVPENLARALGGFGGVSSTAAAYSGTGALLRRPSRATNLDLIEMLGAEGPELNAMISDLAATVNRPNSLNVGTIFGSVVSDPSVINEIEREQNVQDLESIFDIIGQ